MLSDMSKWTGSENSENASLMVREMGVSPKAPWWLRGLLLTLTLPGTPSPPRGVLLGVCCGSASAWLGDSISSRPERNDLDALLVTLLVIGRWLGVGRVGVLNGPVDAFGFATGGGVDGRITGLLNRESYSSLPWTASSAEFSFSSCTNCFS